MIDDNKKSFKKMLKSNVFYLALGLCLLGAGVVGFSATGNKAPSVSPEARTILQEAENKEEVITFEKSQASEIKINIEEFTTVKYEEPETAAVFDNSAEKINESVSEEAQEELCFSPPLANATGMDYSMGVPVFSKTLGDYRTHNGVDFKGIKGESVKTVAEGTVISVKKDALWGNTVTVDHGNGIISSISGLADEALIGNGSKLYDGTIIGVVGTIPVEGEEDSHIHLEMRVNGELTDPLEILGLN